MSYFSHILDVSLLRNRLRMNEEDKIKEEEPLLEKDVHEKIKEEITDKVCKRYKRLDILAINYVMDLYEKKCQEQS